MKNGRYIRIAALVLSLACLCFVFFACKAKECEHVEGEWIIDSAATYQSEGQGHTECTLCGETMRSVELPRLICTHDSETWIVEVEATYETEGQKYCKCDICGTRLASVQIPRRLEESEIVSSLSPFVLSVVCYDYDGVSEISRGSGFIIDGDGTFITNAHVVRGAYYIKVSDHLGATYNVDLLYKYNATTSDYAIGRVKDYAPRFAPEFSLDARVGDTVYALGYAGGSSELSVTRGEITDTAKREGGKYYYANTASIDHGSSGGILADEWGRVIGITTGLAGGDFIAVRYHDFALVLENPLGGGKAPINYFYETRTVTLDANNASEFLDILVHTSEGEGASVTYRVTVKLKDEYKDKIVIMSSGSIDVTVRFDTVFIIESLTPELDDRVEYDNGSVSLSFSDVSELMAGVSGRCDNSVVVDDAECYAVTVSYAAGYTAANGFVTFYSPIE